MSQEGNTLFYPQSSASAPFNSPQSTMNTAGGMGGGAAQAHVTDHHSSDEEKAAPAKTGGKSRRELPAGAVATLKAWLLSPEHFTHPYPTPQDQIMLMHKTGIDKKQLKNWFTNARRRIWKPMLKKQLEAGKLAAAGGVVTAPGGPLGVNAGAATGGISVAVPGGLAVSVPQPELPQQPVQQQAPQQEMYSNFQQAQMQQGDPNQGQYQQQQPQQQQQQYQQQQVQYDQNQQQQPMYDQYGNQVYDQSYQQQQYQQQDAQQQQYQQQNVAVQQQQPQQQQQQQQFPISNSIGSLAPMNPSGSASGSLGSFSKMIKTDSHAVLMELFARDQDLVRQAAGKGGVPPQQQAAAAAAAAQGQQMNGVNATSSLQASGQSGNLRWANGTASPSMGQKQHSVTFEGVPSLSSWPHFSSVSSLNNLGGLQGVKSITNLSAADLSSQGNLNKMGNLAQVKSVENMGRGDSYAFLEVFFDDKSGLANNSGQRGVKRDRDDDDAIGLSLDGDDGASPGQQFNKPAAKQAAATAAESGAPTPAPLPADGKDADGDAKGGHLKSAYQEALAARGLIAVRRSCEKLTDLALPNKMQRTLSQEYIRQQNQGQNMGDFFSTSNSAYAPNNNRNNGSSQQQYSQQNVAVSAMPDGNPSHVDVPSSTKCTLCTEVNVDTQLRPCGHMFHGRCLKPSLQKVEGPPVCPICKTCMQSAILAVPSSTDAPGGVGVAGAAVDNGVTSPSV